MKILVKLIAARKSANWKHNYQIKAKKEVVLAALQLKYVQHKWMIA